MRVVVALATLAGSQLAGCQNGGEPALSPGAVQIVDAPAVDDIPALVRSELARASTARRRLVVYVGASWCEPCQQIHHAIVAHQLDDAFPDLTLVAFDLDRDGPALERGGYASPMIPLFAIPEADGRGGPRREVGGRKDIDNVPLLVAKLHRLLGT